jgi:hypothetical protein
MNQEQISKIEKSVENLKNKTSKIYFIVQDTKGNAKASIRYIYELALSLKNNGFNPIILHEKPDYVGVSSWLGEEYDVLPHQSIEGENLQVAPDDFIVVPELFGFIMDQIKKLPCGKIVLCQAYDNMLETLNAGESWAQFGFLKCITTSEKLTEQIKQVMKNVTFDILEPIISDDFKPNKLPAKPIVAVHSRDQRDTINLIKTFYLKYPQYRWLTLRDMRGLSQSEFADKLSESFVSVWIDETSSYGTFPLESMKSNVPVIGLVPNVLPNWINEDNGIWVNNKTHIVDVLADHLQNWLEDNISDEFLDKIKTTVDTLPSKETFESISVSLFDEYFNVRLTAFEEQISKLQTIEE